ncbi:MAG: GH25 family lysozyme [Limisphaerales bacterium]
MKTLSLIALTLSVSLASTVMAQRPLGIDVSHYQGTITWSSVAGSGISFAWCKATEGTTFTDSTYAYNTSNGKAAGVYMGGYHFAHPESTAPGPQASYFWGVAGANIIGDGLSMMPVLDFETFSGVVGATSYTDWALQWSAAVSNSAAANNVTIRPVLYTSACYGCNFNTAIASMTPWIADYNSQNPQTSTPWTTCTSCEMWGSSVWTVWQYNSSGSVPGISGAVDSDVFNGTSSDLFTTLVIAPSGPPVAPSIMTQPQSQTVTQGQNATFSVSASGTQPMSYQWTFNGANISGATGSSYTVVNAQSANGGTYAVVVSNSAGSVTSADATLTVTPGVAPTITTQPQSQTVIQGQNATFTVGASGSTPLSYQWTFNGANIAGATASSYTVVSAKSTSAGNYAAVVTNAFGTATSATATLTVNKRH